LRSGRKRMMFFLINQFAGELQGGPDVVTGQSVFLFHFLETHPARKASNYLCDWHPCAANHRFAVADAGVNDDLVVHGLILAPVLALTSALFALF
jgi:hypothetical protein